ncbi:MAG: hypothetical protein NXI00_03160 [Cytophagales bacterium]|nr:hypothetical protein [Cytophagales bacterium]
MLKRCFLFLFIAVSFSSVSQNIQFDAKGLVFLSDADMSAFSIIDGNLRKMPDSKDVISTLSFPLNYGDPSQIVSDNASNSVLNSAKSLSITSNQKLAYVLETKGQTGYSQTKYEDLIEDIPAGKYITVVNIENLKSPKSLYRFPVGTNPRAISLSPSNKLLAVSSEEYGKELQVFELDETGKPLRAIKKPNGFSPGRIVDLSWHSSGDYLIYLNQDEADLGVIKLVRDGPTNQVIRLEKFGNTVKIGGLITKGSFTPDGKYYIVLDKKKEAFDLENKANGEVFIIKLNLDDEAGNHFLISRAPVGHNPFSFDIHPSGNYILVNNLEHSFLPPEHYLDSGESSLSVLHLNFNGTIENIKNLKIDGILPTSAVFDKDGQNVALSIFQYLTFGHSFGGIEFFQFNPTEKQILKFQKGKIYVPRGVHTLKPILDY